MPITAMDLVANAKQNITEISVTEAKQALSEHLIIDVREPAEFANGQIPNAVNIPRGVLEFQVNNHPDFTGQHAAKIIVCCQSGGRSALATESLHKLGYRNAISLAGGYKAWAES
ncbi:MAG TPA: rhodanese-like domain-containing protein [Methyloprofundus sp.]|uniref:rhodanese-like domain-containing protein n=1 Tax=Methyloprofundus sp. TaxID=2020875 RepID=UPI001808B5F9|nr:rhodanese-like domain-containing protein [Methyloprofundus sp.]HIG64682.1 rhodanese-like domain-containing protein [Methyloprofundus sp.]HIL78368.1 rhodanese-like domain-containing protein [Methylococcales bacterium]